MVYIYIKYFEACPVQESVIFRLTKGSEMWGLTLCLHAGANQSQRITGELTTGAGHGATGEQNKHAGVGAVGAVLLQVVVLQSLMDEKKNSKCESRANSLQNTLCVFTVSHLIVVCSSDCSPRTLPGQCLHRGWYPTCWGCSLYKMLQVPLSWKSALHNLRYRSTARSFSEQDEFSGPKDRFSKEQVSFNC